MRLYDLFVADGRLARDISAIYTLFIAPSVERYYGERVCLWLEISTARHNTADTTDFHEWHTDAWFFEQLSLEGTTVWLPFDDVGRNAPSLEFKAGDRTLVPVLKAGQGLAFGMDVEHRRQRLAGGRVSVDLRMSPVGGVTPEADKAARLMLDVQDGATGFRHIAAHRAWEQFVPVPGAINVLEPSAPAPGER